MLKREKPVIEINPVCIINRGNNLQVKGNMIDNVSTIFSDYKELKESVKTV
jgi:hypothetical protein